MARYGCLVLGVIGALMLLVGIVYLWSGWLNRPVGRAPATVVTSWTEDRESSQGQIVGPSTALTAGRVRLRTMNRIQVLASLTNGYLLAAGLPR